MIDWTAAKLSVRGSRIYDESGVILCSVGYQGWDGEALARLMAAAPSLYRALDELVTDCYGPTDAGTPCEYHRAAEAALATARGETPS